MLSDEQVFSLLRQHLESQFPKQCKTCKRIFASLRDYVAAVKHLSEPVCWDEEDIQPAEPLGTYAFSNCVCGTTLAIGTQGMSLVTMWRMLRWADVTCRRRGISWGRLLAELRSRMDAQVLAEDASGSPAR